MWLSWVLVDFLILYLGSIKIRRIIQTMIYEIISLLCMPRRNLTSRTNSKWDFTLDGVHAGEIHYSAFSVLNKLLKNVLVQMLIMFSRRNGVEQEIRNKYLRRKSSREIWVALCVCSASHARKEAAAQARAVFWWNRLQPERRVHAMLRRNNIYIWVRLQLSRAKLLF